MANGSRFILHKKLARGGMAEIYLGKQIGEDGFERLCCIKRILPYYAQDQEFIKMFRDEAHICKRLQHANIVRVEGFEAVEGSYAMIMEYVNGGDLRTVLSACEKARVRLSVPMILHIIAEAARGLHYAHTKNDEVTGKHLGIVHRDISPQNILLSFEGEVKVTDFGIADADDKNTDTKPGVVKGKYSYMSPEQISAGSVDARTDIFALSVVLWEMLAMKRLFQGENEVATIQLVKNCQIREDISTLNTHIDPTLAELVMKGLKQNPNDRYPNAAEMEKSLRRYINVSYSEFTASDLSKFLKKLMKERLEEAQQMIKALLSEKVDDRASLPGKNNTLSFDHTDNLNIRIKSDAMAKSASMTGQSRAALQIPSSPKLQGSIGSNQGGLGHGLTRGTQYPTRNQIPPPRSNVQRKNNTTMLLRAGVIGLVLLLGFYLYSNHFKEKLPAVLVLDITPSVVQVTMDGKSPFGNYIKTPARINIPNGKHVITISREGFQEEAFVVDATYDAVIRKEGVVLKQLVPMAPIKVTLKSETLNKVKLALDDGVFKDFLTINQAVSLDNVTFGKVHKLYVFPLAPYNAPTFVCTFIPRAQSWSAPFLITVDPKNNSCAYPPR